MTQNIYDDPDFFAGYSQLPRSLGGLDGAPEWADLMALLPDIKGLRVLDLGCGFGWFCRYAAGEGAASVTGIDISENMLARARSASADPRITYRRSDLETLELEPESFDLVYSSLALHYIERLDVLLAEVAKALRPGSRFVFSAEHPIFTAPLEAGWITGPNGERIWPVDHYLVEGPRDRKWFVDRVVKQHRTITTYIDLLTASGFALVRLIEWGPTDAQIAAHPEWAEERQRPMFMLVSAVRAA
jgi:SAM-dependent methyltransferase